MNNRQDFDETIFRLDTKNSAARGVNDTHLADFQIYQHSDLDDLGILRRVTMSFRGKRSMCLAGGRVQQMLFQRFKVSY